MTDFTRAEIRSQLHAQGFDPPEPDFTEVVHRINALLETLKRLDDLDVYHTEPWPVLPYRGLPQRPAGQGPAASDGEAEPHDLNLAFMTIREQANLLRSGKLSPVELTQTYLDRIDRYDSKLHAFNLVLHDEALSAARAAEVEIASGKYRGPMHGIPVGVKDQFDLKGHPNTGGCDAYHDNIAREDSTIIARFREAGAMIGRSTSPWVSTTTSRSQSSTRMFSSGPLSICSPDRRERDRLPGSARPRGYARPRSHHRRRGHTRPRSRPGGAQASGGIAPGRDRGSWKLARGVDAVGLPRGRTSQGADGHHLLAAPRGSVRRHHCLPAFPRR